MALQTRPPVVTILGHVDHGKTTLLDFIRKTSVAAGEHGGITQAIGAYQVEIPEESKSRESETNRGILRQAQDDFVKNHKITFIDTPGHAAFEKMRSRGAQLADIAVLVVAVDDGVMPQTVEAINHIQSAGISMIVAVNKVDLPGIDVKVQLEKIKKQLSDQKVLVEEYGGDVPIAQVSAKTGQGVPELLETISLVAEMGELKGDPDKPAEGVVIESRMDKFRGPLATVLVRDGSLRKGETITVGGVAARVKGMFDWSGKPVDAVGLSMPVEVLGFAAVPPIGIKFGEGASSAKKEEVKKAALSLIQRLKEGEEKVLNVVIRADKQGSLEAIETMIETLNREEQHIKILLSGTGDIVESDVDLARTTKAIVIGFNVSVTGGARKVAEVEHVLIRNYNVIYELTDELQEVVEGILQPGEIEEVFGRAQIIAEFPFGKNERIAGCKVTEGTIGKGPKVRVVRGDEIIGEGKIKSLKKVREEVQKVEKGMECGILFDPALDFKPGDLVESFRTL